MAAKITIPVEIQTQSNSMQNIVKELEKAASSIDITSSLGKKYTTLLKKIK
jgi:archaellin